MPLFFVYFSYFITYIHSITFIQYIYPSPFAEASLHFFIACMLSGKDLPVVPSRDLNSGLPYSKPTRYQLSHAAPFPPFCRHFPVVKINPQILYMLLYAFYRLLNLMIHLQKCATTMYSTNMPYLCVHQISNSW